MHRNSGRELHRASGRRRSGYGSSTVADWSMGAAARQAAATVQGVGARREMTVCCGRAVITGAVR